MHSDLNLLYGILAVQMDFVSQDALIAAMNAWVLDKRRPLGQVLVDQKVLSPDRHKLLDALVQEHLKQHDNDPAKSLAAVSSVGRVRDAIRQIADPDIQASLGHVRQPGAVDPDATRAPSVGTLTSSGIRFRILRPHRGGGLGEVFVAEDKELHREVALKEIKERYADDLESRARFLLEAEVTGGLEHPGIVPVYGLGTYGDGRPYYAMRFIRGDNLHDAIQSYHEQNGDGRESERTLQFRNLIGRFIDVCNAIEYAHSRGVLHRDLKPGNIMLGRYGETLVVDWGLAKPMESLGERSLTGERPLQPPSASGSSPTMMGSAIGTPQYMSPEQAAGRVELFGPTSDVYSLGATLYCLLTGKSPFEDRDVGVILQKVQRGDFPRPRQVNPSLPKPLEAICLKAMALEPIDRYPTARDLADDLEHWLADEPVSAYQDTLSERIGRWTRRHRAWTQAGAVAILLVAVVSVAASLLINAARQREAAARQEAETSFLQARSTVDDFFTRVSESKLLDVPGLQPLRQELLTAASDYYRGFIEQRENDPSVRRELGATHYRVGLIASELGDKPQAQQSLEKALAIHRELLQADPTSAELRLELSDTCNALGDVAQDADRLEDAQRWFSEARALREELVAELPDKPRYQRKLANSHNNLAVVAARLGKTEDALAEYERANQTRSRLVAAQPDNAQFRSDQAQGLYNLGLLKRQFGDEPGALQSYRAALDAYRAAVERDAVVIDYRREGAVTGRVIGDLLLQAGDSDAARDAYQEALATAEQLARENPLVLELQADVAAVDIGLGRLLLSADPAAARRHLERALLILAPLVERDETIVRYRLNLAICRLHLGMLLLREGDSEAARATLSQAAEEFDHLAADQVELHEVGPGRAACYVHLAMALRNMGLQEEAREALDRARENLAADEAASDWQLRELRATLAYLDGLMKLEAGELQQALPDYQRARLLRQQLVDERPDAAEPRAKLATVLDELAVLLWQLDQRDDALAATREATEHAEFAQSQAPDVAAYRTSLSSHYSNRAILEREAGELPISAELIEKRRALWPDAARELVQVAAQLAALASAVGRGQEALSEDERAQREAFVNRALDVLQEAIDAGYDDFQALDEAPQMAPLRDHPRFQSLRDGQP